MTTRRPGLVMAAVIAFAAPASAAAEATSESRRPAETATAPTSAVPATPWRVVHPPLIDVPPPRTTLTAGAPGEVVAEAALVLTTPLELFEDAPKPLRRTLADEPPPGLRGAEIAGEGALFADVPLTKTEGVPYAVAADRSALWLDSDRDGTLTPSERLEPDHAHAGRLWFAASVPVQQDVDGTVHETLVPVAIGLPRQGRLAFSRLDAVREGVLVHGERATRIAVVDRTFRGWFSHLGRDVLLVDVDGNGLLDASRDSHERYRLGDPFPIGPPGAGQDLVVTGVAPLGRSLTITRSERPAERRAALHPGAPAPDFEATSLTGATFRLSDHAGKWVFLDFWATWCAPCVRELPHLQALRKSHPDVVLLGISGDRSRPALERFVEARGVDWPQVHDTSREVMDLYRVRSFPRSFLVAPNGTIASKDLRGPALERLVTGLRERAVRTGSAPPPDSEADAKP